MPLGRGLMYIGRLNIYRTTTTITSISPTLPNCGDTITFHVTVTNNTGGGPTPTGTVSIINTVSGTVLATGTLTAGSVVISTTLNVSLGKYIAIYSGVHNLFETSTSDISNYNIGLTTTTTTILTVNNLYFCYAQPMFISAHVTPVSGPLPSGSVRFILYSDDINFVELSSATLNDLGDATSIIPAFTTTDGYDYWLQAVYDGYGCWNSSESPGGILGKTLHSISNDVTTTVASISDNPIFCIHQNITLISGTIASLLPPPSVGSVQFTCTDGYTTMDLGTTEIVDGSASLLVLGNTFDPGTFWNVTANYISDGYCYANSSSSGSLTLSPSIFDTTTVIIGPSSLCIGVDTNYDIKISSISPPGELIGTVILELFRDGHGITLGPFDVEGYGTETTVTVTIPNHTTSIGNYILTATFVVKEDSCYNGSISSDFNVESLDC